MPADVPITLVPWFDAEDSPPEKPAHKLLATDQGYGWYYSGRWSPFGAPADEQVFDSPPSVWCDPQPPGDDALTVEHLHIALRLMAGHRGHGIPPEQIADAMRCLRRALESLER